MKKKYLVLAVAAMFTLAAATSCGDSKKSKKDKDDTEEVDDEEKGDEDDYLTQDQATFDLRGPVVAVKYVGEHMEPVTVLFTDRGKVEGIYKFDTEGNMDQANVIREDQRHITEIDFPTLDPWMTLFEYEDDSMLPSATIDSNRMGNATTMTYHRDEDGNLESVDYEEMVHGGKVGETQHPVVRFDATDDHGNWLKCTIIFEGYSYFYKRTIIYEGDDNPLRKEVEETAATDPDIEAFIIDMYDNDRFTDYSFLEAHCTPSMLQYLKDNYEYEGGGYAVWLFRTSAQEGKPGVTNPVSKVTSVQKESDGWYHYRFLDGGWQGENRLKISNEGGVMMIDQIERVHDECADVNS